MKKVVFSVTKQGRYENTHHRLRKQKRETVYTGI